LPEVEPNNANFNASELTLDSAGAQRSAKAAGSLPNGDSADYFLLGNLGVGTVIELSTLTPTANSLSPRVSVVLDPSTVMMDGDGIASDRFARVTVQTAGKYYARVTANSGAGLSAQYLLNVTLTDANAPNILATSLPDAGTTSTALLDRFTLGFSEDMAATTVNTVTSYDLRTSGSDGIFDKLGTEEICQLVWNIVKEHQSDINMTLH
jgi:hypothetical protein